MFIMQVSKYFWLFVGINVVSTPKQIVISEILQERDFLKDKPEKSNERTVTFSGTCTLFKISKLTAQWYRVFFPVFIHVCMITTFDDN